MPLRRRDLKALADILKQERLSRSEVNLKDAPSSVALRPTSPPAEWLSDVLDCAVFKETPPPSAGGRTLGILKLGRDLPQTDIREGTYVVQERTDQRIVLVGADGQTRELDTYPRLDLDTETVESKALIAQNRCVLRYGKLQWSFAPGSRQLLSDPEVDQITAEATAVAGALRNAGQLVGDEQIVPSAALVGLYEGVRALMAPASTAPLHEADGALLGILEVLSNKPLKLQAPQNGAAVSVVRGKYAVRMGPPGAARLVPESGDSDQIIKRQYVQSITESDQPEVALGCWVLGDWGLGGC